jgi:tRNA (guanine-N7-)-methyltransferase
MGRRALPKLDPRVDLSRHLSLLEQLPRPFSPNEFFGRTAGLEIEVGSGKGLFLLGASSKFPDRDFLGNELSAKYSRFAAYRLAQQARGNARVIQGDGWTLFRDYLPDEIADAVHVYFPDPWWKARHRKRRVMQESFVRDIRRVLKPGGMLHFWTDVEEYFRSTCDLVRATVDLTGPHDVPETAPQDDMDFRTHFERRMRKNEHPVFRCQFEKARA